MHAWPESFSFSQTHTWAFPSVQSNGDTCTVAHALSQSELVCLPACLPFLVLFFLLLLLFWILIISHASALCFWFHSPFPMPPPCGISKGKSMLLALIHQQKRKETEWKAREKKIAQKIYSYDSNYIHVANCTSCSFVSLSICRSLFSVAVVVLVLVIYFD